METSGARVVVVVCIMFLLENLTRLLKVLLLWVMTTMLILGLVLTRVTVPTMLEGYRLFRIRIRAIPKLIIG